MTWPASAGLLAAAAGGYLLGSLSFGGILGALRGEDPRSWGSGRLGAWNVGRRLGWPSGLAVFAGDAAKGAAAVWLAGAAGLGDWGRAAAGLGSAAGHIWPLLFGFRGGKGLATALGAVAAFDPALAAAPLLAAGVMLALARDIHLAALAGILVLPWKAVLEGRGPAPALGVGLALLLLWTHREDALRLLGRGRRDPGGGRAPG